MSLGQAHREQMKKLDELIRTIKERKSQIRFSLLDDMMGI